MLNVPSAKSGSTTRDFKLGTLSYSASERVIYWTILLTPIWWLLGIQPLFYPAVIIVLLAVNFEIDKLIQGSLPACVWAWLAMALVMLWTAILGLNSIGFSFQVTAATAVTFFKSYFFIFACLTLPFWSQVRVRVITRAVAWMASGYLITIFIEMVMLALKIGKEGYVPLLARLIPGDKDSMQVFFASIQSFFGVPLPRTVLYTPDPPILGVCAVLCFFICLGETNRRLRNLALAGSLCALIISASRLALICLPLALLINASFRSQLVRQLFLWGASLTSLFCGLLGLTFGELLNRPVETFNNARASSSAERALVVRKTFEAWQQEPWLGWGVIRGTVHLYEDEYVTLGSFSTYAAVLYLHGIVGFICLVCAMVLTLVIFYGPAVRGNSLCKRAFVSLVALYILCNATPLSWMAVYIWFFFVWLGAVMHDTKQHSVVLSRWEQLYGQN